VVKPERWTAQQWEAATLDLLRRDGDRCGWCSRPFGGDGVRHHRMPRRVGGDRLSNLVLLHDACHKDVHSRPEAARDRGVIVSIHGDLLTEPAFHERRGWRLLDDDGRAVLVDRPDPLV
jgi:5-methylcytosine-specific restriction endonuclease McrA